MSDAIEDPRAYLQQRVALFTGVMSVFFAVQLAIDFSASAPGEPTFSSTRLATMAVLAASAAIWSYTRKGKRSAATCRALELAAMVLAMSVFATLPLFPPVPGAGGVMGLFTPITLAVVLMLRAAIVPSPAWLTVALGFAWGGLMTISSVVGWEGVTLAIPGQPADESWKLVFSIGVFGTLALSTVAGVISHVVYGLQTRVRAAMQLGQYTLVEKIGEGGA